MEIANVESFSRLLQLSVSPVVLISGVGLLLLSVTNRLGRAIDRSRALAGEMDRETNVSIREGEKQLRILLQRAEYLRRSVSLIVASVFCSCLMILFLFILIFFDLRLEYVVLAAFCLSLISLLSAMIYLLADIYLSLKALRLEVHRHLN